MCFPPARRFRAWRSLKSFASFYPFYLGEHSNPTCLALALFSGNAWWLAAAPFCGYGFAWVGHFFFEKNRPATFSHPLYSFLGDWVMLRDMLIGRIRF